MLSKKICVVLYDIDLYSTNFKVITHPLPMAQCGCNMSQICPIWEKICPRQVTTDRRTFLFLRVTQQSEIMRGYKHKLHVWKKKYKKHSNEFNYCDYIATIKLS